MSKHFHEEDGADGSENEDLFRGWGSSATRTRRESGGTRIGGQSQRGGLRLLGVTINPRHWAIPVARIGEVRFQIHALLVVFAVVMVAGASSPAATELRGWAATEIGLFALMGWVAALMVHETGHVIARCCFRQHIPAAARTQDIILAPFGDFAEHEALRKPSHEAAVAIAGPIFSVAACAVLSTALWQHFGPFVVGDALRFIADFPAAYSRMAENGKPGALWTILWWVNAAGFLISSINLLPSPPLDGFIFGHSLARSRLGYWPAVGVVSFLGVLTATILGISALLVGNVLLLSLAGICGWASWQELTRLTWAWEESQLAVNLLETRATPPPWRKSESHSVTDSLSPADSTDSLPGLSGTGHLRTPGSADSSAAGSKGAADPRRGPIGDLVDSHLSAAAQARQREDQNLDRILQKISRSGMASLTAEECEFLSLATKRRRDSATGE